MALSNDLSFQITLPSNVSLDLFPANQPNNFITELNRELNLQGDWEAAVLDIQYPNSWQNLLETSEFAFLTTSKHVVPRQPLGGWPGSVLAHRCPDPEYPPFFHNCQLDNLAHMFLLWLGFSERHLHRDEFLYFRSEIEAGHYNSINKLGQYLLRAYNESRKKPQHFRFPDPQVMQSPELKFRQDALTGKIFLSTSWPEPDKEHNFYIISLSPYLFRDILGFEPTYEFSVLDRYRISPNEKLYVFQLNIQGQRMARMEFLSSMYVYSSLIKHQLVGNTEAPLLGIVPIQDSGDVSETKNQCYYGFPQLVYVPLASHQIRRIKIELRTDWGAYFPFLKYATHKVICRINLRRRDRKYLV